MAAFRFRIGVAALLLAVLAAPALAAPAVHWPQDGSDVPADSAVRFGALANGMRYIIAPNHTPPGEVSLRLRIAAGSLEEQDDQQGLAHLLEHMAFRGAKGVPEGEVQKRLERLGLRMGADTNASTGQRQTVYRFDLPNNRSETLDTGLDLLRAIAGDLTLDPAALEKERGVVLAELRLRDTPDTRASEAQAKFLLSGQYALTRIPIGKAAVIRDVPVARLRDFYRTYYRPSRATMIVAGDVDPDAMAAKLEAVFGDWADPAADGTDPDLGVPETRGLDAATFSEPAAPRFVSVSWTAPYDGAPDTMAHERALRIEAIGLAIVNQHLRRAATAANAPFLGANVQRVNMWHSARVATLSVAYDGTDWRDALIGAEKICRAVVDRGVTQAEVNRDAMAWVARAKAAAARAPTRTSPAIARGLLRALDYDEVYTSPAVDLDIVQAQLFRLSADEVNKALRAAFSGNGPLLFLSSQTPVRDGEAALKAAWRDAQDLPVAADQAPADVVWPYTDFGMAGAVVDRRRFPALGVTRVRFANGVTLKVKPTAFRADAIRVSVRLAGGIEVLPSDRPSAIWADNAFIAGGLKGIDYFDLRQALATKIYSVHFGGDDNAFILSGRTRPADLKTQMQVLAAYVTAPGWHDDAFQRQRSAYALELTDMDATPLAVFSNHFAALAHSGDARWAVPNVESVRGTTLADLRALLEPVLRSAPITIAMVGNVTVDDAIGAVAATFGALPPRGAGNPADTQVAFPSPPPAPVVLHHRGRSDQAVAAIAWPTTDNFTHPRDEHVRAVLNAILQARITDRLREQDGATYAPHAVNYGSLAFPGDGYIAAYAQLPPADAADFFGAVSAIVADLKANGPGADELQRARAPMVSAASRALQGNGAWVSLLSQPLSDARVAFIENYVSDIEHVDAADVQAAAARFLDGARALRLTVLPEPGRTASMRPVAAGAAAAP